MTQDQLKQILNYNPITGVFAWLVRVGNARAGTVAGTNASGYIQIRYAGKGYLAHRLAVLYMLGYMPEHEVDHKDNCKSNNCWNNLRLATSGQNHQNSKRTKSNKTGAVGVSFDKKTNKFYASIKKGYKSYNLGYHDTLELAALAYAEAKAKLHTFHPTVNQSTVFSAVGNS